jgi:hypothetical protein
MALATLLVASIAAIGAAGESMQQLVVSKMGTRDFIPRSVACLPRIPVAATYQADFAPEGRLLVQWQDEALLDAGQLALLEQVLTIGATAMGRIADARDVGERLTAGSFTPQLIKQLSQAGLLRAVFNDLAYFSTQTLVHPRRPGRRHSRRCGGWTASTSARCRTTSCTVTTTSGAALTCTSWTRASIRRTRSSRPRRAAGSAA